MADHYRASETAVLSNFLVDLAERVREANAASSAAKLTSIEKALEAGHLLNEAKSQCPHGEWLPFLKRAGIGERTAQNYMTLVRAGMKSETVADLGGIRASLSFAAKWRLPTFDETMIVADPLRLTEASPVGRGGAFIWEDEQHRGHFIVGLIVNRNGEEECVSSRRPMRPFIRCEGGRPVNAIIHFMTLHFPLPIGEWDIAFVPHEPKMALVLAPFFTDDTLREMEAAGGAG